MGKKSKRQDKYYQEYSEASQDKPSLSIILKVGGAPLTPDVGSDSLDDGTERRAKKKRKILDKSDSEDESELSQRWCQQNVDDEDDDEFGKPRAHREKRSTTDEKTPLQSCLDYIQKVLQRKDVNGFFAFPVTDSIAPGYSNVIPKAMDFSTMRKKIDKGLYKSVGEYKIDYQLMMNNCMAYNHPDTIYHKEAKRLLGVGNKHINKERINQMRRNFAFMSNLTREEMILNDEQENGTENCAGESSNNESVIADKKDVKLGKYEAIPDNMSPKEILQQVQSAANSASQRLQTWAPNSKIGYLTKKADETTTLTILNPDNSGIISPNERVVDLGSLTGRLTSGSDCVASVKEDKRNKVAPVTYLNYGAFTSFAPIYDSTSANLDKNQSDLLLSRYGDETGLQYAKSLQHFVANSGEYAISMVDDLLNVLTNGEHSKTLEGGIQANVEPTLLTSDSVNLHPCSMATDDMLIKTSDLILSLHETQDNRIKQDHLTRTDNCKPSTYEINLANQVTNELTQLIKNVTPGDVVGVKELRQAMGIPLDLLDSESIIEDLLQQNATHLPPENQSNQNPTQSKVWMPQTHETMQVCNVQPSSQVTLNGSFQTMQNIAQDGAMMLGTNGQMILPRAPSFQANATQLLLDGDFQGATSFGAIDAQYNVQSTDAGGIQTVNSLIQGGNVYLQGDVQQLVPGFLQGNLSSELCKVQTNPFAAQQPLYNTNTSLSQHNEQFLVQ